MKLLLLFITLIRSVTCMGQENDTCSLYQMNHLKAFYQTHSWKRIVPSDTIYYHNMIFSANKAKLEELAVWAQQQGFNAIVRPTSSPDPAHSFNIIIEKELMPDGETQLVHEVQSIADKRKELGIYVCNGSALAAGKSFIAFLSKDKN